MKQREFHRGDRAFARVLRLGAFGLPLLLALIGLFLFRGAGPALEKFGWPFIVSTTWDPVRQDYGALPALFGTLVSSFLAVLIAAPVSVGVALLLTELLPSRLSRIIGFLVEMLAAIPSVVYGLWGIFVLAPLLRTQVQPALGEALGFLPLFSGPPYGVGMLAAGLILSIMIIPTIASISKEVFRAIPRQLRESALALGATRWETMKLAVLKTGWSGVFGAITLGLGRALGETMAVTMVIGNRPDISASLFAPAQTMSSVLANEYTEATTDLHAAALIEIGLVLFALTFAINALARLFVLRSTLGRSPR
ncbi:MAG: phosphate ABC transporter permease subunit PstC [Oligoflexia bacterium]|nr:phosphate ABC transporter permease subunit PstC [Oligoflexia bacterium]